MKVFSIGWQKEKMLDAARIFLLGPAELRVREDERGGLITATGN